MNKNLNKKSVIEQLNIILEFGLANVERYPQYSFMIFGYNRNSITDWMESQVTESLGHAKEAGGLISHLGSHPSLTII